jgi:hypothetical protein
MIFLSLFSYLLDIVDLVFTLILTPLITLMNAIPVPSSTLLQRFFGYADFLLPIGVLKPTLALIFGYYLILFVLWLLKKVHIVG